jgi:phosphoribosylanthranilate isomerase
MGADGGGGLGVLIKICGTTSEDDALLAVAMGANAIGFIFSPSPRQISPQRVSDIVKRLPREDLLTVGVFRDDAPRRVVEVVYAAGLQAAQLHGRESPEEARWVRQRVPMVIKALPAGDPRVAKADEYGADAVLLDAPNPGSGLVFDWALASDLPEGQRLIVAGGLTPDNVAAAIASSHPWGVDVATGVEVSPGVKDPMKVKAFVEAAKRAAAELGAAEAGPPLVPGAPALAGPYDWEDDE